MRATAQALSRTLVELGYRAADVHRSYSFAAIESADQAVHTVEVAAFFDAPASYKNAALAIVKTTSSEAAVAAVAQSRSLGAPYLVVISPDKASAWTYTSRGPTLVKEATADQWHELLSGDQRFQAHAVRDLKSLKLRDEPDTAASLFDPSTLYALQAQTQAALDALLRAFLAHFEGTVVAGGLTLEKDYRVLFPMVFRLLAAKILSDRADSRIKDLDLQSVADVLERIGQLYSLPVLALRWTQARRKQLQSAWVSLRDGLYVRNVAADDLAFVYENTLITPDVRRRYGTHSTPSCVADYVVRSFALPGGEQARELVVYEPFAGSCVFLTAALRRFKEILPRHWTPKRTHEHLVPRFRASELDPFACEIARLALILADYPNHNGWRIANEDLFAEDTLLRRMQECDIAICNPPFEDLETQGNASSIHKPLIVLDAIIEAAPRYVGIVMPDGFSTHKKYRSSIERLLRKYADVEILKLPEGIFSRATIGAEVLIAQGRRSDLDAMDKASIRSTEVSRADWFQFAHSLKPSAQRSVEVDLKSAPGLTGLKPLRDVWEELRLHRQLGEDFDVHRGLEWDTNQAEASRKKPAAGFRLGLHTIGQSIAQFRVLNMVYLDCRPERMRGGGLLRRWEDDKVICNAVRTSRGPWRLTAALDTGHLVLSQQFFGIWHKPEESAAKGTKSTQLTLPEVACLLNSPLANAFSFIHDDQKRLRVETMKQLPLPRVALSKALPDLVNQYRARAGGVDDGPLFASAERAPEDLLMEIDALVLAAYDLPPKLERELLRFMSQGTRPCGHAFPPYPGIQEDLGAIPLSSRLAMKPGQIEKAWDRFSRPLSAALAEIF